MNYKIYILNKHLNPNQRLINEFVNMFDWNSFLIFIFHYLLIINYFLNMIVFIKMLIHYHY